MLGRKIAVGGAAPRTTLVLGESEEGEGAEWGTQGDPWQERTWQQEEQEFKTATKEKTTFANRRKTTTRVRQCKRKADHWSVTRPGS